MGKTMRILNMMEKYMFSLKFLRESPWKKNTPRIIEVTAER